MKLNVDILIDNLRQTMQVKCSGDHARQRALRRPEFYEPGSILRANHLYLSQTDSLPNRPTAEEGAVLICVGGTPPSAYMGSGKCCCLRLEDRVDLHTAFNLVQRIFDRYDEWEDALQQTLDATSSIQEMIEESYSVFENPIIVSDFDYHFIAYSKLIDQDDSLSYYRPNENNQYDPDRFTGIIGENWMNRDLRKSFTICGGNQVQHYSKNLFVKEKYIGNMKIPFVFREYRESDSVLGDYLANFLEKAFEKNTKLRRDYVEPRNALLKDLLDGISFGTNAKRPLLSGELTGAYLCARLAVPKQTIAKIPISYILGYMEQVFPSCMAFEYDKFAVVYIDLKQANKSVREVLDKLQQLAEEMQLKGGVSCPFKELADARTYYRQAAMASVIGEAREPGKRCFYFQDYKLIYMCNCSIGEFSLSSMLSPGLKQLIRHDLSASISYVDTLRRYLENNLNSTKTASELFIHRSTFLERIKTIETILEMDLDNPDHRLYLSIILKRMEMQNNIDL